MIADIVSACGLVADVLGFALFTYELMSSLKVERALLDMEKGQSFAEILNEVATQKESDGLQKVLQIARMLPELEFSRYFKVEKDSITALDSCEYNKVINELASKTKDSEEYELIQNFWFKYPSFRHVALLCYSSELRKNQMFGFRRFTIFCGIVLVFIGFILQLASIWL
ncbi:MAG: hypothetical protein HUU50_16920 [Candidatus Brocadiae bacterium]|nr:hypothetical protein [Candidatus Brocadiia bacterium]